MENGPRMLQPGTDDLLAFVLDFVYAQAHHVACPTFNLDLAGPEKRQIYCSLGPLNTKSRQGTGTLTSPTAETGQQLRTLAFSSQRSGFWSLASRLIPTGSTIPERLEEMLFRSGPILSSFCAASFVIAGQDLPPLPSLDRFQVEVPVHCGQVS
jgi:hypothetical protein